MADSTIPEAVPSQRRWAGIISRLCAVLALVGFVGGSAVCLVYADDEGLYFHGEEALAGALLLLGAAVGLGMLPVNRRPDRLATGSSLRSISLFLQLLVVISFTVVVLAVLTRWQILHLKSPLFTSALPFVVALVGVCACAAHLMALGRPERPQRSATANIVVPVGLLAGLVLAVVGLMVAFGDEGVTKLMHLTPGDAGMVYLGAVVLLALVTHAAQVLPSVMEIFVAAEAASLPGGRARSVVLPVVIAFSLLVVSLLLFLLFGVGVAGALGQVAGNPIILGVLVFIVGAMGAGLFVATRLVRHEETSAPLYRPYTDPRAKLERETLYLTSGLALLLFAFGGATFADYTPFQAGLWIHFVSLGLMVGLGPYGYMVAREAKRIQRLEERFPDFLREIASSHKGGLTLAEAVTVSARGDYGPLSPEVKRMADQVAWNVPFTEALERFSDRVQTPLVQRAVNLILEADRSGGSSTDVLIAAARDAREIKTLENERRISMSLYTIIIYITFFVFLGVAAVLYGQFVPQLVESSKAAAAARGSAGAVQGIGGETLQKEQFQMFYFLAAMVQALGDGIVAGMMGTGRAILGLRHSFLMVVFTYITFVVLLR